jgi:hypothetical protein
MDDFLSDYRFGWPQAQIDNISLTQTVVDTAGPITSNVVINPNPVAVNTGSSLTATDSDSTTGGSNARLKRRRHRPSLGHLSAFLTVRRL